MSLELDLAQYRKLQAYIALKQDLAALTSAAKADPANRARLAGMYAAARNSARALAAQCRGREVLEARDMIAAARQRLVDIGVIE